MFNLLSQKMCNNALKILILENGYTNKRAEKSQA